jgi:hypothetical protein
MDMKSDLLVGRVVKRVLGASVIREQFCPLLRQFVSARDRSESGLR